VSRTRGCLTDWNKINQICPKFAEPREVCENGSCESNDRISLLLCFVTVGDTNNRCSYRAEWQIALNPLHRKSKVQVTDWRMCCCMFSGSRSVTFKNFRTSTSNRLSNFSRDSRVPIARCIDLRDSFSRGPYIKFEVHSPKPASSKAIVKTGLSEQVAPFLSRISFAMLTSLSMINDWPAALAWTILPGMNVNGLHRYSRMGCAPYFRAHSV
jgi:hypothetical protein